MRMAAVDIGTVTTRLLIADVSGMDVVPLRREVVITQLGEGLQETGRLSDAAMGRVEEALIGFRKIMEGLGVDRATAIATSASRDAENAADFKAMLSRLGFDLAIIPGAREAQLSFLGAASQFPGKGLAVVDIGGGSTEITLGNLDVSSLPPGTVASPEILASHSFDIGCRRMTDIYLKADPPEEGEMDALRDAVRSEMGPFFENLPMAPSFMIAVAGTATSVVSMCKGMEVYDPEKVHGSVVSRAMLADVTERMCGLSLDQRRHVVGLDPGRAGIIVAGLAILGCVLDLSGLPSFTVSESDILQGILISTQQGS